MRWRSADRPPTTFAQIRQGEINCQLVMGLSVLASIVGVAAMIIDHPSESNVGTALLSLALFALANQRRRYYYQHRTNWRP